MRKVTKIEAPKKEPRQLTVADMDREMRFRIEGWDHWYMRTNRSDWPIVSIQTGELWPAARVNDSLVTEVLAPGESLKIGPEE